MATSTAMVMPGHAMARMPIARPTIPLTIRTVELVMAAASLRVPVAAVAAMDFEAPSARDVLGWRRHLDLEDAVLELRVGLIRHRPVGQRDLAVEGSVRSLDPVEATLF